MNNITEEILNKSIKIEHLKDNIYIDINKQTYKIIDDKAIILKNTESKIVHIYPYVIYENEIYKVMFPNDCNELYCRNFQLEKFIIKYNINTNNVTNAKKMFENCKKLIDLDLTKFDVSNVTDMQDMFGYCERLTNLDLSNFNTSNVTNMRNMFVQCYLLTNLNLSNFNTSNVTDMQDMFVFCYNLTKLDLSNFNTSNVKYMDNMFFNCCNLIELDISHFDISNLLTAEYMFCDCNSLINLNMYNFKTNNLHVNSMISIFENCEKLKWLNINNIVIDCNYNIDFTEFLCYNCISLKMISLNKYDKNILPYKNKYIFDMNLSIILL